MKSMETQGPSKAFPLLGYLAGLPMQMLCSIINYECHLKFFPWVRTISLYLSDYLELMGNEYPNVSIHLLAFEPQCHRYLSMEGLAEPNRPCVYEGFFLEESRLKTEQF